jgi:hypothetical protein
VKIPLKDQVAFKLTTTAKVLIVALLGGWSFSLSAQTITIRLLNAKTGEPMGNKMVTLEWGVMERSEVKSDKQGLGTVEVPAGVKEFSLLSGPKVGKEPYRIPYLDCNEGRPDFIEVSLVLEKGYVLRNTCGHKSAVARPGEVVFWLLPNPWWMPDMQ